MRVVCALASLTVALTAVSVSAAGIAGSSAEPPALSSDSTPEMISETGTPAPTVATRVAVSKTNADASAEQSAGAPATTTEIPAVAPSTAATAAESGAPAAEPAGQQVGPEEYDDGVIRYQHAKDSDITGPPIGSLDDFMSEGDITSPLGIEVREDKRALKSGGEAQGLLIVNVFAGSPAAHAGLHPYHRRMREVLETAAVAGAMFVPPVVLLVPVFDQVRLGESYDLIIGVDGSRVTNFLDFEQRLHDVQAGEIVYFSIVRNGVRMQVPVPVPENLADPTF